MRPLHLPLLLALALTLSGCSDASPALSTPLTVDINGRRFHLELALTPQAQVQGLSDREEIAADGGMLFVFPREKPLGFVMRRCPVPIDVIFLGPTGRVLNWHEMQVEPPEVRDDPSRERDLKLYTSDAPGQFAIELKGGTTRTLGLKKGQKIELPLETLKTNAR